MDRIKKSRKPVRAAVTRVIGSIEVELGKEEPSAEQLDALQRGLDREFTKLCELDDQLHEAFLDADATEEELEAESVAKLEYIARVDITKVMVEKFLHRPTSPPHSTNGYSTATEGISKKNFKLPKIELKKFSGELTEWLGWWAQFQKIDEDEDLHASDKFQYLVQCMVQGTRARDLVDSYPQSKENYPKVVAALKERFGKAKLLKQVYVRELIKMILLKSREKWKLSALFDKLESHLRSLESLGVTAEQMSEFLFPMVESCLPEDILIAWQRSALYEKDGSLENPPKIEMDFLMEFLKKEIDREGQRSLALAGFGLMPVNEKKTGPTKKKSISEESEEDIPTAAGLFSAESRHLSCIFCDRRHESGHCFKAQVMSLEDKKNKIYEKRACFNCLIPGHQSKVCKKIVQCAICGKKHQSLLCQDQSSNKEESTSKATMSTLNCTSEVILQSFMVFVKNPVSGRKKLVRVMIDNGSQRSYISKKVAEHLSLQSQEDVTLTHHLFGGSQAVGKTHKRYTVTLESARGEYSIDCKVLDQADICGAIPRVAKGPWLGELKRKKIYVNDLDTGNPLEVEMLIGSDFLGQILTGKLSHLANGLTATETRFGWTLMGEIKRRDSSIAMSVISMSLTSVIISDEYNLKIVGSMDPVEVVSSGQENLTASVQTVNRSPRGCYSIEQPRIKKTTSARPSFEVSCKNGRPLSLKKIEVKEVDRDYLHFSRWENQHRYKALFDSRKADHIDTSFVGLHKDNEVDYLFCDSNVSINLGCNNVVAVSHDENLFDPGILEV